MFTVQEALKLDPLSSAKVVAGREGLNRVVEFVNIMEVPDVKRWMKGGEFLVTAGFAFRENPQLIHTILDDLAAVGVAAFGIKLGAYLDTIPEELISHANRLKIPLIQLPPEVPYMDFMIPIFERLMLSQYRTLRRVEKTHERLISLALRGVGMEGICQTLGEILDTPIFVLDRVANCRARFCAASKADINQILETEMKERFPTLLNRNVLVTQHINRIVYEPIGHLVVVPLEIDGEVGSYLVAYENDNKLDEVSLRAMEHAATVIALEIMREKAVFDQTQHMKAEFLEDLILKRHSSQETLLKRASYCDLNIQSDMIVFVADVDNFNEYLKKNKITNEKQVQKIKRDLLTEIRYGLTARMATTPLLMQRSDSIVGILPLSRQLNEQYYEKLFEEILHKVGQKHHNLKITIGISERRKGVEALNTSYQEARDAVRVSRQINKENDIAFSEDLGAYKFLCDLRNSKAMKEQFDSTVGKLRDYDQQYSADLVHTLEVYFDSDRNIRLTADRLYMHRNSVVYRLKKIESILNKDLTDPEDQFNLQLALRLKNIINNFDIED